MPSYLPSASYFDDDCFFLFVLKYSRTRGGGGGGVQSRSVDVLVQKYRLQAYSPLVVPTLDFNISLKMNILPRATT